MSPKIVLFILVLVTSLFIAGFGYDYYLYRMSLDICLSILHSALDSAMRVEKMDIPVENWTSEMNNKKSSELSFDCGLNLTSDEECLPLTPKQELLNNKSNESVSYPKNCGFKVSTSPQCNRIRRGQSPSSDQMDTLSSGHRKAAQRHSEMSSPNLSPICDQNMAEIETNEEQMITEFNEDNDNHLICDNRSTLMTNGDINDNNPMTDESLIMDQMEFHSDPELISDDISQQINIELKNGLNNQSISDTLIVNNNIKSNFYETDDKITIYLYVKDVFDVNIDFHEDSLEVRFKTKESPNPNNIYVWRKNLQGRIYPEECSHKLLSKTIELYLKKKESNFRWNSIEPTSPSTDRSLIPYSEPTLDSLLPSMDPTLSNSWQRIVAPTDETDKKRLELGSNFKACDPSVCSEGKELVAVVDNTNKLVSTAIREIKPKLIGWTGLQNLGNTCFMNAVIQCLSNTDPLRDYFISGEYVSDINGSNPFGSGGVIAQTFADLLRNLWAGTDISIAPHKLKEKMGEKWATFSSYLQQDAQEFCAFLLDALHEDLNRIRERPVIKEDKNEESNDSIDDQILADESWHRYGLLNNSIVTQLFYGQYKSRLVCPICGKISVTFDPFVYLSLPLPKPKQEYEVYFFKRDSNGMSSSKPKKYTIKLTKDCIVQNLLDQISNATGIKTSSLRCIQSNNKGLVEKFLQPKWTLNRPEIGKYLLIFELRSPKANEEVSEFVVVQRLTQPPKSDNCAKCDKNSGWDNVELKSCQSCYRVSYCDKTCQTEHWPIHRKDCIKKPEPLAVPFVISVPKSELTFRNLCAIVYSYARHSVQLREKLPLNLNEFPIPPPFVLRIYRDLNKSEMEEQITPDPELGVDMPLNITNYYIALDWINAKGLAESWIDVQPIIGLNCDSDYDYSLTQNSDVIDLEECLELHTKQEKLTPENPWYCPKCKESREAVKQITLWRLPHFLVIQLKRFSFRNILWREKIDSMVRYPIEGLDMSRYYVRTDNNPDFHPTYDLYAVVNHYGGLFGGHYTAFAQTSNNYKNIGWRCFDDTHVEPIEKERIVTRNAYMLFYKLRENI